MASTEVIAQHSPHDVVPIDTVAARPPRPELLFLGTALASAAVALGYLGLIAHYIAERALALQAGQIWLPSGVSIPLTQPNFQGVTLAFSVVSIWWAAWSIRNDERFYTVIAYGLSTIFALAFIFQTFFLLNIMAMDLSAVGPDGERTVLLYAVIGSHLVIMVAAIIYALVMAFRTLGGEFSSRYSEGVLSSALFWTVAVALYGVLWYVVYITK